MSITVAEFNELYKGKFRLHALKPYKEMQRFALQEWCPGLNQWNHKLPRAQMVTFKGGLDKTPDQIQLNDRIFEELKGESVIIDQDEYGMRVFSAKTTEEATLVLLSILENEAYTRLFQYMEVGPADGEPKRKPEDFQDDPALRKVIEDQWKQYNARNTEYREYVALKADRERAIETNDGLLALQVLECLQNSYDKVEFHELETVKLEEESEAHTVS